MIYISLFWCLFASFAIARAQLSFSPAGPYCDGDTVTFTCILVPAGNDFHSIVANIRFVNDSNTCYPRNQINSNNTGPIDSTRYNHQNIVPGIGSPNASAVLEINPFRIVDASIPFSCCVLTSGTTFISNSISPILADPPSSFLFNHVFTDFLNCEAELSISAPTISSDRPLTHYNLFINNKLINTSAANGNDYSFSGNISFDQNSVNITVTAYSCAGATSSSAFETTSCVLPSGLTTPAIIGIVVGGLFFIFIILVIIILVLFTFILLSKRKERQRL